MRRGGSEGASVSICRQSAKSLELRATMSLARLWQQQDKKTEVHELLAEIYGWFTCRSYNLIGQWGKGFVV